MGVKTSALLTDMNQPLGRLAGNLVEVQESIASLEGRGPADLWQCTRELGAELLVLTGHASNLGAAVVTLDAALQSGRALVKFREMVAAQGGNLDRLPPRAEQHDISLDWSGFIHSIDTQWLGIVIIELGGGRKVMTDKIDPAVGLEMLVRIGDHIKAGQPVVRVFGSAEKCNRIRRTIASAFTKSDQPVSPPPLVVERIQ